MKFVARDFLTFKIDLNKHVTSVHEGKKSFKCEVCHYRSSQKDDLKKHIAAVHEGKKPFKCEVCHYRVQIL